MKNIEKFALQLKIAVIFIFVVLASVLSGANLPGSADAELDAKWSNFSQQYKVNRFGE